MYMYVKYIFDIFFDIHADEVIVALEDKIEESSGRISPPPSPVEQQQTSPDASAPTNDVTAAETQISKPSLSSLPRDESLDVSVDDEDLLLVG